VYSSIATTRSGVGGDDGQTVGQTACVHGLERILEAAELELARPDPA
jgi:hypothetical protein